VTRAREGECGMNGHRGYLLIELCLAMFIMTIFGYQLALLQATMATLQTNALHTMQATRLASRIIDTIQKNHQMPLSNDYDLEGFTIHWQLRSPDMPFVTMNKKSQTWHLITLAVSWPSHEKSQNSITLCAGVMLNA
jgi:hypothetical protein